MGRFQECLTRFHDDEKALVEAGELLSRLWRGCRQASLGLLDTQSGMRMVAGFFRLFGGRAMPVLLHDECNSTASYR